MRLHAVTLLVDDYDEAIAHYVDDLGFSLVEDTPLGSGKRWVRVAPDPDGGTSLILAVATSDAQRAAIGNQTGGRVGLFLHTDDFAAHHARLIARGGAHDRVPSVRAVRHGGRVPGPVREPLGPDRAERDSAMTREDLRSDDVGSRTCRSS